MELNELVRRLLELKARESIMQGFVSRTRAEKRVRLFDAKHKVRDEIREVEAQIEKVVGEIDLTAIYEEVAAFVDRK